MKRIDKWLCALLAGIMLFLLLPAAAENDGGVPEVLAGVVLLKEGDSGDAVAALQQRL